MRELRTRTLLRGSTLIELMIAFTLLLIVVGGATMASQRGLAVVRTSSARSELIARSGRSLDRVMRELVAVGGSTLGPSLVTPAGGPTVWSESLEFRCATDWVANAVVLGPVNRIAFETADGELENGVDDDGDGLVDEGVIALVRDVGGADEQRTVIATGIAALLEGELANGLDDNGNGLVDERGLCFDRAVGELNVRISVESAAPDGGRFVLTLEDAMDIRN